MFTKAVFAYGLNIKVDSQSSRERGNGRFDDWFFGSVLPCHRKLWKLDPTSPPIYTWRRNRIVSHCGCTLTTRSLGLSLALIRSAATTVRFRAANPTVTSPMPQRQETGDPYVDFHRHQSRIERFCLRQTHIGDVYYEGDRSVCVTTQAKCWASKPVSFASKILTGESSPSIQATTQPVFRYFRTFR
jgi:hypothetical protein